MATKKYVSLDRLTKYDELIKKEIAKKADSGHSHDSRYYTETEIDNKLSAVNTSIDNITSGEVVVEEAKHAQSATTSNSCTGNAATATTASKLGTKAVGSTTQPIYLDNGVATGVTKVDVSYGGTNATTAAGARTNLGVYSTTEIDTKLSGKSDTSHNHDTKYDAKGAAATAETNSKDYTDDKIALLLNNSSEAVDSIYELRDAMENNADAIEALNSIASGKANASHNHTASNITSGTLSSDRLPTVPIAKGGTGATTAAAALTNLGLTATAAELNKMDGVTATTTELNYLDGVTSAIQTQLNGKADSHTHPYLPLSGGTLTGNLTGKYLTGTWLQTTATTELSDAASKIAVIDSSGWVYYRTPANILSDIGAAEKSHTHSNATTSAAGFMSTTDKSKLDGIASGANAYTHPTYTARTGKPTANQTPSFGGTATVSQITSDTSGHVTGATDRTITIPNTLSNGTGTAGLIKTTSTVTSNSGYTACPVINGVPYYKDTNTTYSLSSFGITATAAELNALDGITATVTELNYCDGVTSNIQTQLNGKAASSHNHSASNITSGTLSSDRLPTVPVTKGGTGATTAQGAVDNLIAGTSIQPLSIEFTGMPNPPSGVTINGGYIDFHYPNGNADFTSRFIEYSDGLYIERNGDAITKEKVVSEGAWKSITLNSGVTEVTNGGNRPLAYRKIGNHVYITGSISFTASDSAITAFTIPSGYRPKQGVVLWAVASSNLARIQMYANGQFKVDAVYNQAGSKLTSGSVSWCSIQMDYFVD